MSVVPSYLAKVSRAEKHLVELQEAIDAYALTSPYTVRKRIEGKKKRKTWRLAFTSSPANTDIPIIAADAIYNLRSALDHMMSALVSTKDRSKSIFPVYFQGVWEPPHPGEDEQRLKFRSRWASDTKSIKPAALAVLKGAQPADDGGQDLDAAHYLRVLNRWSNRDRHEKLPVMAAGLKQMMVRYRERPGGKWKHGVALPIRADSFFKDQAEIRLPDTAVEVEATGIPAIAISVGGAKRYLEIPAHLEQTAALMRQTLFPALLPYVRPT